MSATDFGLHTILLLVFPAMFALVTMLSLVNQVAGTPYVSGGDTPVGTDCSGLASWVSNVASGRPAFGDRFHTGNQEAALLKRGFQHGTAPNALVIGWNGSHTAVTLPDGTPVSSGERGGVRIGGGGAYQDQFTHHMFLPIPPEELQGTLGQSDVAPAMVPVFVDPMSPQLPAPQLPPPPAPELPPPPAPELIPPPAPEAAVGHPNVVA